MLEVAYWIFLSTATGSISAMSFSKRVLAKYLAIASGILSLLSFGAGFFFFEGMKDANLRMRNLIDSRVFPEYNLDIIKREIEKPYYDISVIDLDSIRARKAKEAIVYLAERETRKNFNSKIYQEQTSIYLRFQRLKKFILLWAGCTCFLPIMLIYIKDIVDKKNQRRNTHRDNSIY